MVTLRRKYQDALDEDLSYNQASDQASEYIAKLPIVVDIPPEAKDEVVLSSQRVSEKEMSLDRIKKAEDELFEKSLYATNRALEYGDIPTDSVGPTKEWINKYGEKEAWRRFRFVKAAQLDSKACPVGVKIAQAVVVGIVRARAVEKATPSFHAEKAILYIETPRQYPERDVTDD